MAARRSLDAAPLVEAVESRGGLGELLRRRGTGTLLAERLARAYRRAREAGSVTEHAADTLCIQLLGEHPLLVFGDEWLLAEHRTVPVAPEAAVGTVEGQKTAS